MKTATKLSRSGESYAEVLATAAIIGLLIAVPLFFIQGGNSTESIGRFIGLLFTVLFWAFIIIFGVMFLNFTVVFVVGLLSGRIGGGGKLQNIAQSQREAEEEQKRVEAAETKATWQ
jgi:predicted membrane protein